MRSTSLLISFLMAACASTSSDSTPDRSNTTPCSLSVDDSCGRFGCDRTLDAAEHDPQLCSPGFPAALIDCGDFQVVRKSELDTGTSYYYKDGQLTAIVEYVVGASFLACSAGPERFEAPQCSGTGVLLPACTATH
jgi:hypothetical protein